VAEALMSAVKESCQAKGNKELRKEEIGAIHKE